MANEYEQQALIAFRSQRSFRSTERDAFIKGYVARAEKEAAESLGVGAGDLRPELRGHPCDLKPEFYGELHGGEPYEKDIPIGMLYCGLFTIVLAGLCLLPMV